MVEAMSQLYRCVAPVQPWLYYLLETYQGPEKVVGIFFSIMYTMSKGSDLLSRLRLFRTAAWKLFQNVVRTIFIHEYIFRLLYCNIITLCDNAFFFFTEPRSISVEGTADCIRRYMCHLSRRIYYTS